MGPKETGVVLLESSSKQIMIVSFHGAKDRFLGSERNFDAARLHDDHWTRRMLITHSKAPVSDDYSFYEVGGKKESSGECNNDGVVLVCAVRVMRREVERGFGIGMELYCTMERVGRSVSGISYLVCGGSFIA